MSNVTGWNELMNGEMVSAAYVALNEPLGGALILIFYVVILLIMWQRTQSVELATMMSFIFLGVFMVAPWFQRTHIAVAIIITAFLLGATIFKLIAKEKNY